MKSVAKKKYDTDNKYDHEAFSAGDLIHDFLFGLLLKYFAQRKLTRNRETDNESDHESDQQLQ